MIIYTVELLNKWKKEMKGLLRHEKEQKDAYTKTESDS